MIGLAMHTEAAMSVNELILDDMVLREREDLYGLLLVNETLIFGSC